MSILTETEVKWMILVVCVDNNMGMLFNGRRQSRDRKLLERLLEKAAQSKLWINDFSRDLFTGQKFEQLCISDEFLNEAQQGEYCLTENINPENISAKIEKIILYKWNRDYPADFYFAWPEGNWKLAGAADFAGFSHEKITEEVYVNA